MHTCLGCKAQIYNLLHECGKPYKKNPIEVIPGQERKIVATFTNHE